MNATRGWFAIPAGVALAGYAGYRLRSRRRALLAHGLAMQPAARFGAPALRFNPPPGWPMPEFGWTPPPGWRPDLSWPQPRRAGGSGSRTIRRRLASGPPGPSPQDVKIAVAARDGGRCRQCCSTTDLHFDHVIPWSKGGAQYRGEHPVAPRPVQPPQGRRRHPSRHLASRPRLETESGWV